ncbi:MAG: Cof-type HAD-IIB family hydrolase [Clostridiales bacterium]|nr:Cof-type HAD-IIB family hydrolase [Clostridiales bacterium]
MGKFDGVLLYSDYDDTLYNSAHTVSPENHAAIRYFQENGGRFSVATGRAHRTFTPQIALENLSLNAPVVLSNGAALYDYDQDRYLMRTFLDEAAPARFVELFQDFPDLALEAYHDDSIYVYNPNLVTTEHLKRVGGRQTPCAIPEMPTPWTKVILEQDEPYLKEVQARLLQRWDDNYEAIFSNPYLLEVTAKGSHKGTAVAKAAELLGVSRENLYCIGDNQNDIPMLALSAIPFAPSNCSQPVKDWGARLLDSCDDHAVAQAIEILDKRY